MFYRVCGHTATQRDPNSCAPSSVASMLNLLEVDPQQQWKGIWRWYDEDTIKHRPQRYSWALLEVADILRNNEASLRTFFPDIPLNAKLLDTQRLCIYDARKEGLFHATALCEVHHEVNDLNAHTLSELREKTSAEPCVLEGQQLTLSRLSLPLLRELLSFLTRREDMYLLANYHRAELGQTGAGHYSPIGAYSPSRQSLLVHDIAKFKYGFHWVSVSDFYAAMSREDAVTHLSRGLLVVANRVQVQSGRLRGFHLRHGLEEDWRGQLRNPVVGGQTGLLSIVNAPFFAEFAWKYWLEREMVRDEDVQAAALYTQLHAESCSAPADLQATADSAIAAHPLLSRLCSELLPLEQSSFRLLLTAVAGRLSLAGLPPPTGLLREELDYLLSFYFDP